MKLALIGDIHSNHKALEECLTYCYEVGVDGFIFLGDYISDCPHPQKTMKIIKSIDPRYSTWFIRGNREDYQINHQDGVEDGWQYCSNSGSLLYTYDNLTKEDIEFSRRCKIAMKIRLPGLPEITVCHGSPKSTRELLHIGSDLADQYLEELDTEILVCAHTHIQGIYEAHGKKLINPGSVGVPMGHHGKPQFAILHGKDGMWIPELVAIDYDLEEYLKEFEDREYKEKAKVFAKMVPHELKTGHNYLIDILRKTYELTIAGEGEINQDNMPEQYWEQAYKELFSE